ncbi:hypothetical protein CRM22_009617 [Opisthorchis felineus]|uniref:Nuclear pore complex protein Nup160 n=1 Tax=Opisthorchis felineus TaxID=147828 RepID=A0A4S2L8A9_OPIFE|nr:hypothetical protein CRM22_009617 [Opisthorchis felineus]
MEFSEVYDFEAAGPTNARVLKVYSDAATRTLQEISFPNKAGGFGYTTRTSSVTSSRFIIWRSDGESLELMQTSLDDYSVSDWLTVCFSGSAVVNCCVTSGSNSIECLVCTSNGGARLSFSLSFERPRLFKDCLDFYSFYQIKGLQPSLINTSTAGLIQETAEVVFAYGLSSGSILVARAAFGTTEISEVFELHQASMIQKLWSGITPFAKSDNDPSAVLDMVLIMTDCGDHLIVSVCKDHRLRLWDLKHRDCLQVLELLDLLPDHSACSVGSLHLHLAPGSFHRIISYSMNSGDSVGLLVYLSLSPNSSLGSMQNALSSSGACSANYWCWIQLDLSNFRRRDRECLRVKGIDRLATPASPVYASKSTSNWEQSGIEEFSVLDFIPTQLNVSPFWSSNENSVFRRRHPENHGVLENLHGVWWLAQQVTDNQASLDDRYYVQWSCGSPHTVSVPVVKNGTAVPPGIYPDNRIPIWRHQPPILVQTQENILASTTEECTCRITVDDVDEFLDFLFSPGRFSRFAIASSLKSLRNSHQLPAEDTVTLFERMGELRSEVRRTLVDELFYITELGDFLTVLKTFHATAIDYHEYGLQPLGLFEVPYGTALLTSDQRTYLPYAPGLVIVRRWGFSVLRPFDHDERLFWNQQSDQPLCIPPEPASSDTCSSKLDVSKAAAQLAIRTRVLLEYLCKETSWHTWKSILYGSASPFLVDPDHSWDPNKLAETILEELGGRFGSFEPSPFADPFDWQRFVFLDPRSRTTELLALDMLTKLLEQRPFACFGQTASDMANDRSRSDPMDQDILGNLLHSNRNQQASNPLWFASTRSESAHLPATLNPLSACKDSRLGLRFLCQTVTEICELRLKLAFGLLVIATHLHLNPSNVEVAFSGFNENSGFLTSTSILVRLTKLVHSFRLLHWLGSTRMRPTPDAEKLTSIREHLNILGMSSSIDRETPSAPDLLRSTSSSSMQLPGMTLLQQICSDWSWLQNLFSMDSDLTSRPCMLRSTHLVSLLCSALSPSEDFGHGLLRVFRHLLVGGHAVPLLTLIKLLESTPSQESLDSDSFSTPLWTWDGDYCLLFLCTGLAHLWLGNPELAEKDFIRASESLKSHVQASLLHSTVDRPLFPEQHQSSLHDLLIGSLFPGEFTSEKLLCSKDGQEISADTVCPTEVQVRFLMKVMPVLEAADCVSQVLNLSEFSLNLLANVQLAPDEMNDEHSGQPELKQCARNYSRRLTSILSNLHAFGDGTSEGFLCNPLPDEELVTGKSPQSGLYVRLADLEAALWTRMFKHHLSLGNYANAHFLIRSNPDAARRRDCLRQLIATLCDRGESARLVDFHYGSAEQECVLILEARARATDVLPSFVAFSKQEPICTVNPYYDVLYAFHIRRSNYRAAAMILFEHVHRLMEETSCPMSSLDGAGFRAGGARLLFGLQRQAANLAAAINALYIVQKEHQWLIRPGAVSFDDDAYGRWPRSSDADGEEHDLEEERTGLQLLVENDWAFADPDEETASLSTDAEMTSRQDELVDCSMTEPARSGDMIRLAQEKQILQLNDLLRLYTLIRARLRLVQVCWEQGMLRAGSSSPQETVQSLLSLALYDEAIRLTEQFGLDWTPVVSAVATRCAELAQHVSRTQVPMHNGYGNSTSTSGAHSLTDAPSLPGLSSVSSPLSYEAELVIQSLHRLNESVLRKDASGGGVATGTWNLSINELYWRLLEIVLKRLDPPTANPSLRSPHNHCPLVNGGGGQLHLLACEHLLNSKPNQLHLPQWLVSHLVSPAIVTTRSVGLLRLYMRYDRVEAAYLLTMELLDTAITSLTDASTPGLQLPMSGCTSCSFEKQKLCTQPIWLPHNLIVRLSEALRSLSNEFPACQIMHENLEKNMINYFGRLQLACSKLVTVN